MTDARAISHVVIALDGPAASGKSSVARELARRLGFVYVNSGAMYRAVTWHLLQTGIDLQNVDLIEKEIGRMRIDCDVHNHESRIVINGVDPAAHLRDETVNKSVSLVSSCPRVRQVLVEKMRSYLRNHDLVMEGRDIGSIVFPNTPFKFYIDAPPEVRHQRRVTQGQQDEIATRDQADSSRQTSPLVVGKDAEVIDTSKLSIQEVVDLLVRRLREKGFDRE